MGTASAVMRTLTAIAVVSCLSTSVLCVVYHQRALDRLARIEQRLEHEAAMTLSSSWSSGGTTVTVTTTRTDAESDEQFVQRHKTAVAVAKIAFPPG